MIPFGRNLLRCACLRPFDIRLQPVVIQQRRSPRCSKPQPAALHAQPIASHHDLVPFGQRAVLHHPLAVDASTDDGTQVNQLHTTANALKLGMYARHAPAAQLHLGLLAPADTARQARHRNGATFPALFLDHDFQHVRHLTLKGFIAPQAASIVAASVPPAINRPSPSRQPWWIGRPHYPGSIQHVELLPERIGSLLQSLNTRIRGKR